MSQGTLYVMEASPRSSILVDLVKNFKLDIEVSTETQIRCFLEEIPIG